MCGIFGGTSSRLDKSEVELIFDLGLLSKLRGYDSTGLAVAVGNKDVFVDKELVSSDEFLVDCREEVFALDRKTIILGHTRAGTIGSNIIENAHPHCYGDIVGVHNGTIPGFIDPENHHLSDSAYFYKRLGAGEPLVDLLREIENKNGAYVFIWLNKKDRTLNFIKNEKRPLTFWKNHDLTTLYWASENSFFEFLENRGKHSGMNIKKCSDMPNHTLLTMPFGNISKKKTIPLHKSIFGLPEKPQEVVSTHVMLPAPKTAQRRETTNPFRTQVSRYQEREPKDLVKVEGTNSYAGWRHQHLSVSVAMKTVNGGCNCCGSIPLLTDKIYFFKPTKFVCSDCVDSSLVQDYVVPSLEGGLLYESKFPVPTYQPKEL